LNWSEFGGITDQLLDPTSAGSVRLTLAICCHGFELAATWRKGVQFNTAGTFATTSSGQLLMFVDRHSPNIDECEHVIITSCYRAKNDSLQFASA
jgi:hypothetical protein